MPVIPWGGRGRRFKSSRPDIDFARVTSFHFLTQMPFVPYFVTKITFTAAPELRFGVQGVLLLGFLLIALQKTRAIGSLLLCAIRISAYMQHN